MFQKDFSVAQAGLSTKYKNNIFNTIDEFINKRLTVSDVPENGTKKMVKNTPSTSENTQVPQPWA